MSGLRSIGEVARWEFLRYVKPKQQLVSLTLTFAVLMGIQAVREMGSDSARVALAVIGAEHLPALPEQTVRFEFRHHAPAEEPALRESVEDGGVPGLLILHADGAGELLARQDPSWRAELTRELTVASQMQRLLGTGMDVADLSAFQAPFQLEVRETAARAGGSERAAVIMAMTLVLVGLLSGMGYIFSSVTGEKQNRLSEQVVSAIPAQAWIDGKILGLAAVSMVVIVNVVVAVLLSVAASLAIWGNALPLPTSFERAELLLPALALVLLGYLFWFSFLTAVAALVDDPQTSARSQLLLLPGLAMVPAFTAMSNPDAVWVRALALLPPTSATVMPARLLVSAVPWWEVGLAGVALIAATLAMRRLAGKIFRLAMLMYGKEPSWSEVRRWVSEA